MIIRTTSFSPRKTIISYSLDEGCKWTANNDGQGADETKLSGTYTYSQCAAACKQRAREENPDINGATVNPSTKECWCEIGMTGEKASDIYDTCFLPGRLNLSLFFSTVIYLILMNL